MADALDVPYGQLLDALDVAVVVFDREGKVRVANRCAREAFAQLTEPVIERGVFRHGLDMVDEHGAPIDAALLPSVRTLQRGEVLTNFLMGVRSSRQGIVWVEVGSAPITARVDWAVEIAISATSPAVGSTTSAQSANASTPS